MYKREFSLSGQIIDIQNQQIYSGTVYVENGKIARIVPEETTETQYILPGFIDAHCHFTNYGLDKYKCKLFFTKSFAEVVERIKEYEKINQYGWIYGRGWDQKRLGFKGIPR